MQEAHIHTLSRAKAISPSIVCTSFVNSIIYLQKQCGPISNLKTPIICGTVLKYWRSKKIIEIPAFMRRLSSPYICFFFCINFSSSDPFWSVHCDPILGASNRQALPLAGRACLFITAIDKGWRYSCRFPASAVPSPEGQPGTGHAARALLWIATGQAPLR